VVSVGVARQRIAALSQRASNERRRAARAGVIAAELEGRCHRAPTLWWPKLSWLIQLHRMVEVRHLEAARLQENYASRLDGWSREGGTPAVLPTFVGAVASAIGAWSAAVILVGRDGAESLVAASGRTAQIVGDTEFVFGEGPAHDAVAQAATVRAEGGMLVERWSGFGPAVAEHGVGSVIGHPLPPNPGGCLGALCVYEPAPTMPDGIATTSTRVADALAHIVFTAPGAVPAGEFSAVSMLDDTDLLATLHQAAGVVSVQHSCGTGDAVVLLRARAFADGTPVETLAKQVIRGDLQL
jgi:hypothetical protein